MFFTPVFQKCEKWKIGLMTYFHIKIDGSSISKLGFTEIPKISKIGHF